MISMIAYPLLTRFITYYISVVHSSGYRWNAKRRYRDFLSLREKLIGIGFDKVYLALIQDLIEIRIFL